MSDAQIRISVITPTIRGKEGLKRPKNSLKYQEFSGFEWLFECHNANEPSDLNAALNRMVKKAKGELIVFLQDYISIENNNGLQQFWDAYQAHPDFWFTAPVGKTVDNKNITWDWRKYRTFEEGANYMEWEIDWGCASKKALIHTGGFDEELDKHWGFDNVNIGMRAVDKGYKIANLRENTAIAIDHNLFFKHPYQKLRNPDFHNQRLDEIRQGAVIQYL